MNNNNDKMIIIETNEQFGNLEKNGYWSRAGRTKAYKTIAGVKRAWAAMEKNGGCDDVQPVAVNSDLIWWSGSRGFVFFLCGK